MRRSLTAMAVFLLLATTVGCGATHTLLCDAINAGDPARAKQAIDNGASPDEECACGPDAGETTPLICSIEVGRPEIARMLVERKVDLGRIEPFGYTPLMAAARRDVDLVRLLLDKGANIDGRGSGWVNGRTALMSAVDAGKEDVVRLLLERGAAVGPRSQYGWDALCVAAVHQRAGIARMLLSKGADIDYALSKAEAAANEASSGDAKAKNLAAVRLLRDLKEKYTACAIRYQPDRAMETSFPETAAKYRALPAKPELPEEARVFRVQAEDAVVRKRFQEAVDLYGKTLAVSPWWPEGHFNQALILGESDCPEEAVTAMERYLALVPDAPDARAAHDKVYQWKGRIP